MLLPLIAAGYIILTPKFFRDLRKIRAMEKSEREAFDLDLQKQAESSAIGPSDLRSIANIKKGDWEAAKKAATELMLSKRALKLSSYPGFRSPEFEDFERMEGLIDPVEFLVRDSEYGISDEYDSLRIEGRSFRPNHSQDLIQFGIFIARKLNDPDGEYDGWRLNDDDEKDPQSNRGWFQLYVDWFMMYGFDRESAEEFVWKGEVPWFDINAQRLGMVG